MDTPERGFFSMRIQNNRDLLQFLIERSESGDKDWFGFAQQKIAGIDLCYAIAINHADKMSSEDIVNFVLNLNNHIYDKMLSKKYGRNFNE